MCNASSGSQGSPILEGGGGGRASFVRDLCVCVCVCVFLGTLHASEKQQVRSWDFFRLILTYPRVGNITGL